MKNNKAEVFSEIDRLLEYKTNDKIMRTCVYFVELKGKELNFIRRIDGAWFSYDLETGRISKYYSCSDCC